jgi:hypothetical protein
MLGKTTINLRIASHSSPFPSIKFRVDGPPTEPHCAFCRLEFVFTAVQWTPHDSLVRGNATVRVSYMQSRMHMEIFENPIRL